MQVTRTPFGTTPAGEPVEIFTLVNGRGLEARIATYELAAKMQTAAKEATDLSRESEKTKAMYGLDDKRTADFVQARETVWRKTPTPIPA